MTRTHRPRPPTVLAVDRNFLPMLELPRRHALKAVASGRAQALDLHTWARLAFDGLSTSRSLKVIVYPHAQAVAESRLGLGHGGYGILRRDAHRCQYCSAKATTLDHVVPRCQGGPSTWTNLVACCLPCNQRKGGRTPEQAGMGLLRPVRGARYLLFERFQELSEGAM